MSFHFVQTRVEIHPAGSPWPEADALVLPSNDYLWMASGPGLEVKKLAGEEIELAAVRQGPIALGEVAVTAAGALPLAGIVHAAVMGQDLHVDAPAAARALRRALDSAAEKRWRRLLIHSLSSTGRGTGPAAVRDALRAMVDAFLEGSTIREVTLLVGNEAERSLVHESLVRIIQGHP